MGGLNITYRRLRRFVVAIGISQILFTNHLQSNKDVLRVCIYGCSVSTSLHTAWASCCKFLIGGQCESLYSGTATRESRFFCVCELRSVDLVL